MLGITIAKYGTDQVVLSKLKPDNFIALRLLYRNRVVPLILIFCLITGFIKSFIYALYFLPVLPMEVFSVIVSVELNISRKYTKAALIVFFGYPLILTLVFILGMFHRITEHGVFIVFLVSSLLRFMTALLARNKVAEEDIAITSYLLPLQQVGNYIMFRMDQVIIAGGLSAAFFIKEFSVTQYLFLAKFPDLSSGIIVGLAPILYKKLGDHSRFSIRDLLRDKNFRGISLTLFLAQIVAYTFFLKLKQPGHGILIYFPFLLSTLLILPANLITYVLLKSNDVKKINMLNLVAILAGLLIVGTALVSGLTLLYCFTIPGILLTYILLYHYRFAK